jgi:hypothetical protein
MPSKPGGRITGPFTMSETAENPGRIVASARRARDRRCGHRIWERINLVRTVRKYESDTERFQDYDPSWNDVGVLPPALATSSARCGTGHPAIGRASFAPMGGVDSIA